MEQWFGFDQYNVKRGEQAKSNEIGFTGWQAAIFGGVESWHAAGTETAFPCGCLPAPGSYSLALRPG